MMRRVGRAWILLLALVATAACGDPETTDDRGYTKAPLEHPTVLIRGEEPSAMRRFGEPKLPLAEPLELDEPESD